MNDLLNARTRQLQSKVQIAFAGVQIDPSIAVITTNTEAFSQPELLVNNSPTPTFPWFALGNNDLTGNNRILPEDYQTTNEIGVWSDYLSDGSGNVAPSFIIEVTHLPRAYSFISVVGDTYSDVFPVDFVVTFYQAGSILAYTHTVTSNTLSNYVGFFTVVENVEKIKLEVTKINKASERVRIVEFFATILDEYTQSDRIVGFSILEELFPDTDTLSLGQASINELDLTLSNRDFIFNPGVDARGSLLLKNRIIRPFIGVTTNTGAVDWFPLGKFYSVSWSLNQNDARVLNCVARDRMELIRTLNYNVGTVQTNKTLKELFEQLFAFAGWTNYYIDPSLSSIILAYSWFGEVSLLEAFKQLASVTLIAIWVDKEDIVQVREIASLAGAPEITFADNTNIIGRQYPNRLAEPINSVTVVVNTPKEVATTNIYDATVSIDVPAGSHIDVEVLFSTDKVISVDTITITPGSVTGTAETTYCYRGIIRLTNGTGSPITVTKLELEGTVVELQATSQVTEADTVAINKNGLIQLTPIDKPFIQNSTIATNLADILLAYHAESSQDILLSTRGDVSIELGDSASITDLTDNYLITRQKIEYDGGLKVLVDAKILGVI